MKYLGFKLSRTWEILSEITILGIIFFVPIYFAYFLKTNNQFELSKIIFLKILVLFLLFCSIIKLVGNAGFLNRFCKRLFNIFFEKPHIFIKYFFIPLLFLFYIIIINNFQDSFVSYGNLYYRCQGLESLIFYFLFFILLIFNIKDIKQANRIVTAAFLSSVIVSLYGLAQIAGFDFINWEEPALTIGRTFSSLGQPNFLASYLLLVISLGFYLIFSAHKLLVQFIIFCGVLVNLLALYFTYSRGALVGFMGGVLISVILWTIIKRDVAKVLINKYKKRLIFLGATIFLAALFLLIFNNSFFFTRLKSMADFSLGSNAVRINIWQASIQAIKERPIFGYGWESQQNVLVNYYKKDWAVHERVNMTPDRAHNLFLDIWLTTGITGLLIYLLLLFFLFKLTIDNIRNSKYTILTFFIFGGLVSYLISLMFSFSIVATDIYFWLYFALAIILNSNFAMAKSFYVPNENYQNNLPSKSQNLNIRNFFLFTILVLLTAVPIFYKINLEFKKLIADHYFFELRKANLNNEPYKAFELFSYIRDLKVEDSYYKKSFGLMVADLLRDNDLPIYRKPGEKILNDALNIVKSDNYFDVFAKGKIYTALATEEKEDYYNLAEENFKKATGLSPEMPQTYYEFANMYLKKGDFEKAEENYHKSLDFLPNTNDPRMNSPHRQYVNFQKYLVYKKLGDLESKRKNYEKAEGYYWFAFNNKPDDILLYRKIADTYYMRRDLDKAIWYNKRGMMLNPPDYAWPLSIAFLYEEGKNIEKAKEYAKIVLDLDKENNEAKRILSLK